MEKTSPFQKMKLPEAKKVNRELLLRGQLKPVLSDFDVALIDTPPAMSAATIYDADKKITEIEPMAVHGQKEGMLFEPSNLKTVSKMVVSYPDKTELGTLG